MRILIVHDPSPLAQELADAVHRGASRCARVCVCAVDEGAAAEVPGTDVLVLASTEGRRGRLERFVATLPPCEARAVIITARPRRHARGPARTLARTARRRGVPLLLPPRSLRLDEAGRFDGSAWERAYELGEDLVVAAGGTVTIEPIVADAL